MKRTGVIFLILFAVFCGLWIYKIKTASSATTVSDQAESSWWEATGTSVTANADWVLDPEIPENYIPVPGRDELYMVIDDSGNISEYRHRTQQEDGSWIWETVDPNIPENYEPVEGLENVYRVTAEDGTVSYYKYLRNDDNSFAFVPVDENGNVIEETISGDTIPDNYLRIIGNTYAVYNENGVCIGYRERQLQEDGSYIWIDVPAPEITTPTDITAYNGEPGNTQGSVIVIPSSTAPSTAGTTPSVPVTTQVNQNGTYTETETLITTKNENGYVVTYQTIVSRVYDASGTLMSTKKSEPIEISRVKAGGDTSASAPDTGSIAGTLSEEDARVSVGLSYKDDMAAEILSLLNADRAGEGLGTLSMDPDSDAYRIARIIAADMANYNHSDYQTVTYGSLGDILTRFNIASASPSENVWRATGDKTANDIEVRFSALESSSTVRMNPNYTTVGIAIVSKNGYLYICEVYL